eukprot:TRINITY_DN4966_c0_g1_i2.p1 TRINITY_DN4966_c0_g1~~TRINITY_DN4966_c0_g1_i2.p1  ORF type:complete len:1151 (+),score=259.80 TRINITY_DN4966_c0_g1_i2:177-3629(+)
MLRASLRLQRPLWPRTLKRNYATQDPANPYKVPTEPTRNFTLAQSSITPSPSATGKKAPNSQTPIPERNPIDLFLPTRERFSGTRDFFLQLLHTHPTTKTALIVPQAQSTKERLQRAFRSDPSLHNLRLWLRYELNRGAPVDMDQVLALAQKNRLNLTIDDYNRLLAHCRNTTSASSEAGAVMATHMPGFNRYKPGQARRIYEALVKDGLRPNVNTMSHLIAASVSVDEMEYAQRILSDHMFSIIRDPSSIQEDRIIFGVPPEEKNSQAARMLLNYYDSLMDDVVVRTVENVDELDVGLLARHNRKRSYLEIAKEKRGKDERKLQAAQESSPEDVNRGVHQHAISAILNNEAESPFFKQLRLETQALEIAALQYREMVQDMTKRGQVASLIPANDIAGQWMEPLKREIELEHELIKSKIYGLDRQIYGPFISLLAPSKLATIAIHETIGCVMAEGMLGVKMVKACIAVGRAVQLEIGTKILKEKKKGKMDIPSSVNALKQLGSRNVGEFAPTIWAKAIQAKLGACLIGLLLRCAEFTDENGVTHKAFRHYYHFDSMRRTGRLTCHKSLWERMSQGFGVQESLHPIFLPMVVEPKPWSHVNTGSYLTLRTPVMRCRGSRAQLQELRMSDLSKLHLGLTILGKTPWRINEPVFSVIEHLWEAGGGIADLPPRQNYLIPPEPENLEELPFEDKRLYLAMKARVEQMNRDLHSNRSGILVRLKVAREFIGTKMFFPHNVDFRGRAYPLPPHLNHLGPDVCRGMLLFAEGKPLGKDGLRWIKIHLANLCGKDKLSFDSREEFVDKNIPNIMDSAERPLEGSRWWLTTESPFQVLAACIDLSQALKHPNPEEYISYLPIHQDGSCNGLQHYAALGRDANGGLQVGLVPTPTPQDVYQVVANSLNDRITKMADRGLPTAMLLNGKVERKIVKQTVMTSVYGVTYIGARRQIQNRLQERGDIPEDKLYYCACFLARHTLEALGESFLGAKLTMEWLAHCARLIAATGRPVSWVTPLGIPIVQPYRKSSSVQVKTMLQHLVLAAHNDDAPIMAGQQRTAFPPNFIHSLDSTHMFMTAIECDRNNVAFAAVHDSFWTHAGTTTSMNSILREQFINLHSENILEDLRNQFMAAHPDIRFPEVPPRGTLDLSIIRDSPYFFD